MGGLCLWCSGFYAVGGFMFYGVVDFLPWV